MPKIIPLCGFFHEGGDQWGERSFRLHKICIYSHYRCAHTPWKKTHFLTVGIHFCKAAIKEQSNRSKLLSSKHTNKPCYITIATTKLPRLATNQVFSKYELACSLLLHCLLSEQRKMVQSSVCMCVHIPPLITACVFFDQSARKTVYESLCCRITDVIMGCEWRR